MPNLSPGPAGQGNSNVQSQLDAIGAAISYTFATLPSAGNYAAGTQVYTSDQGPFYTDGTNWHLIVTNPVALPADPSVLANTDLVTVYSQANTEATAVNMAKLTTFVGALNFASGIAITPNCLYGQNYSVNTATGGTFTVNAPTGTPVEGQRLTLRLKCTNSQTYSWNAIYRGSTSAALPATSTGSGLNDYLGFIYNSTDTKWDFVSTVTGF